MAASGTTPVEKQEDLIKASEEAIQRFRRAEKKYEPELQKFKAAHGGMLPIDRFNTPVILARKIDAIKAMEMKDPPIPSEKQIEIKAQLAGLEYRAKVDIHNFVVGYGLEKDKLKPYVDKITEILQAVDAPLKEKETKLLEEVQRENKEEKKSELKEVQDQRQKIKEQQDAIKGIDPTALNEELKELQKRADEQERKVTNLATKEMQNKIMFELTKSNARAVVWEPIFDPKQETLEENVGIAMRIGEDTLDKLQKSNARFYRNKGSDVSVRFSQDKVTGKTEFHPIIRRGDDPVKCWKEALNFLALKTQAANSGVDLDIDLSVATSERAQLTALTIMAQMIDHADKPLNMKINISDQVLLAALQLPMPKHKALQDKILKAAQKAKDRAANEAREAATEVKSDQPKRQMMQDHMKAIKGEDKKEEKAPELKDAKAIEVELNKIKESEEKIKAAMVEVKILGVKTPPPVEAEVKQLQEWINELKAAQQKDIERAKACYEAALQLSEAERSVPLRAAAEAKAGLINFYYSDILYNEGVIQRGNKDAKDLIAHHQAELKKEKPTLAAIDGDPTAEGERKKLDEFAGQIRERIMKLSAASDELKTRAKPDAKLESAEAEALKRLAEDIRLERAELFKLCEQHNERVKAVHPTTNAAIFSTAEQSHLNDNTKRPLARIKEMPTDLEKAFQALGVVPPLETLTPVTPAAGVRLGGA